MNSLMTSRSSGSAEGHCAVSSSLSVSAVAGAVFGGDEGMAAFFRCSLACCAHIVLSSMKMMFSASIVVDVMVTGTVGDSVVLFRIGDGGDGNFGVFLGLACGFGTWILKESLTESYMVG